MSNYNKYLKEHKLDCDENDNCDKILKEYSNNLENIKEMNNSSNYESLSSVASEEEIIYEYIPFKNEPINSDGGEDSKGSNGNCSVGKHKQGRKKSNNNKNKYKNYKNSNNNNHCIFIDNLITQNILKKMKKNLIFFLL